MSESKQNRFLPYMREDRLPHIFCPGCGNGAIINAFLAAMEKAGMDFDNVAMVSGIGCSSRIPGYLKCDSLHTTHGRALSFATGLKTANKDLDVVVFTGDGDAASIGGNHLIHAARRNINLTVICINNNIYGMTGGQISPTSPKGSLWTTVQIENLVLSIKAGLENPGFSFIEVATQCPTYFGRKNKLRTPTAMAAVMKANTVYKSAADRMSAKELEGKIVVGEFANTTKDEFTENIDKISVEKSGKKTVVNSAYETDL